MFNGEQNKNRMLITTAKTRCVCHNASEFEVY